MLVPLLPMLTTRAFSTCFHVALASGISCCIVGSTAAFQITFTPIVAGAASDDKTAIVVAVIINGLAVDSGSLFLSDREHRVFVPRSFLQSYNLSPLNIHAQNIRGTDYFDLGKIQGIRFSWNQEREEITITASPDAFSKNRLNIGAAASSMKPPSKYSPGAFLNYDISLARSDGKQSTQALLDVGAFAGTGLFTSSFSVNQTDVTRLMSSYSVDYPSQFKTLKIGDVVNSTGAWGRGLLFGGIQYSTNFSIRPDFISIAMPSISGRAVLPSTVDVYVNNTLRSRQKVDAGPFAIQNLPLITGAGEVQLVVKDLLGREQIITQSFFSSPNLLRNGLVEDAYELGWIRHDYGLVSNDYADPFAVVDYRKGISDQWTIEGRVELQQHTVTTGVSLTSALTSLNSTVEASMIVSHTSSNPNDPTLALFPPPSVNGSSVSGVWSYLGRKWSANTKLQYNSPGFRQLGSDPHHLLKQMASLQMNTPIGRGTLAFNVFQQKNYHEASIRLLNLAYSLSINKGMFASIIAVKAFGDAPSTSVGVGFTFLFDPQHFASANSRVSAGANALYVDLQKTTPRDHGVGYRVAAQMGNQTARQEASLMMNQSFGGVQADVVNQQGRLSTRLGAQGGINLLGGDLYFSRGFDDAFAVVQTEGLVGVPIYLENQVVARTNRHGRAIVSNLQSYQNNRISIDPLSLPMEASIEQMERVVVPRYRGGILIDFAVKNVRGATLILRMSNGEFLPAWSSIHINGLAREFVSGKRGEVYVEFLQQQGNNVQATLQDGRQCTLIVNLPEREELIPLLDDLICIEERKQ